MFLNYGILESLGLFLCPGLHLSGQRLVVYSFRERQGWSSVKDVDLGFMAMVRVWAIIRRTESPAREVRGGSDEEETQNEFEFETVVFEGLYEHPVPVFLSELNSEH